MTSDIVPPPAPSAQSPAAVASELAGQPTGWLYTRGQSIAQLEFSADGRSLIAAGRKGVSVFALP